MYKIIIETQYNVINLVTNDIEEYREVFDQPYVKNVEIKELKTLGEKSIGIRHLDEYDIKVIPSVKKRVFMDSDYSVLLNLNEGD